MALNIAGWSIAPHVSQLRKYNSGASFRLEDMGCTPTSGANGLNTVTGRRLDGDDVLAKVRISEEYQPGGGWALNDLDLAMSRLGVGFTIKSGTGRTGVRAAWNAGLATVIQGDSEEFSNNSCSGAFNGDHCICVYPAKKLMFGAYHRWIADPICPSGRWERETEIWQYAENLNPHIRFGVFTKPVTKIVVPPPDTSTATHRAIFERGAKVKVYDVSSSGLILKQPSGSYYRIVVWDHPLSSAACTQPVRRKTADGKSAALTVTVLSGKTYGRKVIAANSDGVTIKEV